MNRRSQFGCGIAGLLGAVLILIGMIVADYLPPPKASWTAAHLAHFYASETDRIRVGLLLLFVGTCGWATLMAVVTVQLLRTEGRRPVLSVLQAVTGTATYVLLLLFTAILSAAAFRPERPPEETQLLHDVGWFMAFLTAPAFVLQALAVGAAILADRTAKPVYPRWLGYVGIWAALLLAPGTILLFFHSGVFAYHGLISYWIPLFAFGGWMVAMSLGALLAAKADDATPTPVA
jgi:hypothetical protein